MLYQASAVCPKEIAHIPHAALWVWIDFLSSVTESYWALIDTVPDMWLRMACDCPHLVMLSLGSTGG